MLMVVSCTALSSRYMQYKSIVARGMKATNGMISRALSLTTFPVSPVAKTATARPRLSATTCCALVLAATSARFSSNTNDLCMGALTTFAVVIPTLLPMLASVASARNFLGKNGVIISTSDDASYTTEDVNRNRFTSESNSRPKFAATPSLPSRPRPSFSTQLMAAAAGNRLLAPMPMAANICCVANTVMHELAILCRKRNLAYSQ